MNVLSTHIGAAIKAKLCAVGNFVADTPIGSTAVDITGQSSLSILVARANAGTQAVRLSYTLNSVTYTVSPYNSQGKHFDTAVGQFDQHDFDLTKLPAGVTAVTPSVLPDAGTTTCVGCIIALYERKKIKDGLEQNQGQVILG